MTFSIASAALSRALSERGYADPTPVQSAVLEAEGGRDLLVSAQTGSGKTVAYGLALAPTLLDEEDRMPVPGAPLALVIAPTRELALQVQRELTWLYGPAGGRVVACVGGMDPRRESQLLAVGCHIVVGTPGRLRDHLERGRLDLSGLAAVVLDEADEMLDLGFREDLEFILQTMPADRRTLLFSATLPRPILALARSVQRDALRIEVAGGESGHADIEYRCVRVLPREIPHAVVNLLRFVDAPVAIVFCNTRESVRHLQALLSERGFPVVALSGELSQSERNGALQALRDGRARVCVATDVAARGIDLPGLDLVVHAELPNDPQVLQHRSGRTGRAGRKGRSVLLVPPSRRRKAESLVSAAGLSPSWSGPPTPEEIRRLDGERLLGSDLFTGEAAEEEGALAASLVAARSAEEIALALVRLQGQRLPAPEDVGDPGFAPPRRETRPAGQDRPPGRERPGRGPQDGPENGRWFRLNVGRNGNADPKWLLPLLCTRGGITKGDIGPIRIFERETKVLIRDNAARGFADKVHGTAVAGIRIDPADGAAEAPARPHRPGPRRPRGPARG